MAVCRCGDDEKELSNIGTSLFRSASSSLIFSSRYDCRRFESSSFDEKFFLSVEYSFSTWWHEKISSNRAGNPYLKGNISTVDLLVLVSLEQLYNILFFQFIKQASLARRSTVQTEPSPSVRVPRIQVIFPPKNKSL